MTCLPHKRSLEVDPMYSHNYPSPSKRPRYECKSSEPLSHSPFSALTNQTMSPDKMAANMKEVEERRNRKRQLRCNRQLNLDKINVPSAIKTNDNNENVAPSNDGNTGTNDNPMFTFSEVTLICQKMLKEQEQRLREEYDKILSDKLSEQYDTFVKFTHDQIQKSFISGNPPSYLS